MTTPILLRKATQAALIAAVLNVLVFLIAKITGVPLQVFQGTIPMDLTALPVALATLIPAYVAAGVYALAQRAGSRGVLVFQGIGWVFLLLSFFPVVTMPVALATKLVLALMHTIAGVTILTLLNARPEAVRTVARS
ncbi:DUF6069 family protein [Deinococcus roseus]|uniref:Uncharacterized protein n=1 Tax=Deinococcus roseus TaxID=392414 RepID=A0ABQ2D525_9DEIO|nr:DUF6069 family protein [Deinococcus roseus]GGJ46474.1 hypothetical protein GCM10008938_35820 [Deinococcus roseus]